jgi:hypothetical protein
MTTNEIPQNSTITPSSLDAYLSRYAPGTGYFGHWHRLRPEVLALVRSMNLQTQESASQNLSALSRLLEVEAPLNPEATLYELLSDINITRLAIRLNALPRSRGNRTQTIKIVTRLHRALHNLPPVTTEALQERLPTLAVSKTEIDLLVYTHLKKPGRTRNIKRQVLRRLILARIAGLCGEKADAAQLVFDGDRLVAILDGAGRERPLALNEHPSLVALVTPDLENFKMPSLLTLSKWMRKRDLSYFWPRLRDDYLIEMTDGSEPALVQLRRISFTEHDMCRLELRWMQCSVVVPENILRFRRIYRQIECEKLDADHDLNQPHQKVRLEAEPAMVMNASIGSKPSKAMARRIAAQYREQSSSSPKPLSKLQTPFVQNFVCKSVQPEDRDEAKKVFVEIMGRAAHIKSMANFRKNASAVSGLIAWAIMMERSLLWSDLMKHEVIHDYTRYWLDSGYTDNKAHELRNLKLLASNLNPGISAPPRVQAIGHKAVASPYSAAEMAAIVRIAQVQGDTNLARQVAFILGACRGAGAAATELRDLTGSSIQDLGDGGLLITLGSDEHRRTIPIRQEWEETMRRGIEGLKPNSLALGKVQNRRNIAGEIFERTVGLGSNAPKIDAGRLRTTYIAELMSEAIPIQVILHATGLLSSRTLTDLAKSFTQEEMNAHFGVLQGRA